VLKLFGCGAASWCEHGLICTRQDDSQTTVHCYPRSAIELRYNRSSDVNAGEGRKIPETTARAKQNGLRFISFQRKTERDTILYSKQFDKLFHHVSYGGTHSADSQPFGDWDTDAVEKRRDKGHGGVRKRLSLVRMHAAWEKRFLWNSKCAGITWPLTSTLILRTY